MRRLVVLILAGLAISAGLFAFWNWPSDEPGTVRVLRFRVEALAARMEQQTDPGWRDAGKIIRSQLVGSERSVFILVDAEAWAYYQKHLP